jgi:uncharacterized protein YheU (UPF0270 family)
MNGYQYHLPEKSPAEPPRTSKPLRDTVDYSELSFSPLLGTEWWISRSSIPSPYPENIPHPLRSAMEIPYSALSPDVLTAIIEEFVLREGTDYGDGEWSLAEKVAEVRRMLTTGGAAIFFDEESESCNVMLKR